ncbi:Hpt domain-containing protein [Sinomicrobium pectinilyticum]|uniref:Hpt domain-containing protein n=1 Tax=Sinomicrobium pectinilyticum TaxID=1084421 RepID=A0A3N0ETJ8_SINP1|nr:Hpt domain-containing protein [Sinomicrobium pectinilyticum]RNL91077.1 Hpt domain-containing protein [Sinomicrobium pectinilyticum]
MPYSLEKLEELSDGDRDFITSVVSVFVEETPADMKELEQAVQTGDFDAIYRHAHKIKPNVDLLGMEETTSLIRVLETKAKEHTDISGIKGMYAEVKEQIREVITELKTDFAL